MNILPVDAGGLAGENAGSGSDKGPSPGKSSSKTVTDTVIGEQNARTHPAPRPPRHPRMLPPLRPFDAFLTLTSALPRPPPALQASTSTP
jgi:hypothetical protein